MAQPPVILNGDNNGRHAVKESRRGRKSIECGAPGVGTI
jgi:hypothetical protein